MNQPASILVVDDVPANRETLRELLDAPHYTVVEAGDGPTALRLAAEAPPDLVLLDVMMPAMDGYEVCRRLRADAHLAEVPVIMVTALDDEASRLAGIEAGADDFITKPFNSSELRARVRTVTRLNRYRRLMDAHHRIREQARWLDEAHDAIFVRDLEDRITYWNEGAARLFGWTREEALGRRAAELMHTDETPFNEELLRAVHSTSDWQGEVCKITKAGREVFLASRLTRLRDARGEPCGVLCINTDITECKRGEEAVHTSQLMLGEIINALPARVFWKDKNLVYLGCNTVFARDAGFAEPKDMIGKDDTQMVWREQAETYRRDDRQVLESGQPKLLIEEPQTTPKGEIITLLSSKLPLRNAKGEIIGVLGMYMDITERKQVEASRDRLAMAVEQSAETVLITDTKGTILYVNPVFEKIAGYSREEAIGRNPRMLKSGKHDAEFYRRMWAVLTAGEVWSGHTINKRKDGTLYEEDATISPVRDSAGRVVNYVAVKRDVTEQKRLEAQSLRAQRMESIGTLAGGIAHDLNNVLAPILMSVEILDGRVSDPAGRSILATLQTSAQRGADLVRQVLSFARGVEGERVLHNPTHLMRELQSILRDTFPKNIGLSFNLERRLWMVVGDPTQLHQVFMNLCVNARDAMPMGGTLSLTMQNIVLDEVFAGMNLEAKPGDYVLVTVTDTGTGMPLDVQERIFEPFFTTKDIAHGTGLGLSTTLAIVKSHGGFISVYSEPGKGTTFRVYLPADQSAQPVENVPVAPAQLPHGHGELVLVVDDEACIREITRKALKRFGYRVLLASHGAEAVALYATHRNQVAVVLTDLAMPIMDGPTTIIALKSMNPQVRIIASSGLASAGGRAKALSAGVPHFIPKPYTTKALLEMLAQMLGEEQKAETPHMQRDSSE